jgi:hypothetical protein
MDDRYETRVERDGRPESLPSINVSQGAFSPMLKPLTLSLSLAVALGFCSVSKAGGYDQNCTTCGLASPQGGPYASGQGVACEQPCAPKKHCFNFHMPKLHCNLPKLTHTCSYEWVLKKKHNWCFTHNKGGNACAAAAPVYATGQGGVAPSGQVLGTGQVFGAGQHTFQPSKPATIAAVPAEMSAAPIGAEEAPPAPEVRETSAIGSSNGGLLLPTPSGN